VGSWCKGKGICIQTDPGTKREVNITALGGSVSTPAGGGTKAEVLEVQGIEDLARYGEEQTSKGKLYSTTGLCGQM
jgi:hypothetical protein